MSMHALQNRFYRRFSRLTGVRTLTYTLFGSLLLFEILNYIGILSFGVAYTWFGRVVSTGGVLLVLLLLEYMFRKKLGTHVSDVVWVSMSILVVIDFSGDFFGWYTSWIRYDQLAHFLSGPLLVSSLFLVFRQAAILLRWKYPEALNYVLALGVDSFLVIMYEAEEYLEDKFFFSQRLGNGPDTANDLLVNIIGGSLFIGAHVAYLYFTQRSARRKLVSPFAPSSFSALHEHR